MKSENDPLDLLVGTPAEKGMAALHYLEDRVLAFGGTALRYGALYGPGAIEDQAELVRKRQYPLVGSGDGHSSWLHLDDAPTSPHARELSIPSTSRPGWHAPSPVRRPSS